MMCRRLQAGARRPHSHPRLHCVCMHCFPRA